MSCSLERPPASTATRMRLTATGVVGTVSVSVAGGGSTKRPTKIVTVAPGLAWDAPVGSWEMTMPSSVGSSVSWSTTLTLKPEASSVDRAVASSDDVTSGIDVVVGPFETVSVTVEPLAASELPFGSWPTTTSFGWSSSTSRRATAKPAPWSCDAAWSYRSPTTDGTATGFGPFETLMRTVEPSITTVPPLGACAVTIPGSSSEETSTTFGSSPAFVSASTASSRRAPTTSGTFTFAFPVETRTVTIDPFVRRVPAPGSCS